MSTTEAMFALLEQAVNRYVRLDPTTIQRLKPLHGRVILLEVSGLGLCIYCIPGPEGLQLYPDFEGEPDCILRGTPLGFARLGGGADQADELFKRAVDIRGDTEIGHRFGDILSDLDIDWEEQFSRLAGDLLAHQAGNGVRSVRDWGLRNADTLALDLKEYLQEELTLLPTHWETAELLAAIDALRDDAERLAARVARLERSTEFKEP